MSRTQHGGDYACCGCSHLSRFVNIGTGPGEIDRKIQEKLDDLHDRNGHREDEPRGLTNHVFEACLTDIQMETGWAPILRRKGFRLVTRFYNSNTGNYVNIFHYSPTRASRRPADLPYEW